MPSVTQSAHRKSDKVFRDALVRAVNRREKGQAGKRGPKQISILADRLVNEGRNGNVTALTAIRDTLDGKPAQAVTVDVAVQITSIERRIIDVTDVDSEDVPALPSPTESDT